MQEIRGNSSIDVLDLLNLSFPDRLDIGGWSEEGTEVHLARERAVEIQKIFKEFIDEWIESGFDNDGKEWPGRRNFNEREDVEVFDGFSYRKCKDGKPIESTPMAITGMQSLFRGNYFLATPQPGRTVYGVSGVGHRPGAAENGDVTGFDIQIHSRGGSSGGVKLLPKLWKKRDSRFIAAWLFMEFYNSDWTTKLVKCRECSKYAVPRTVRKSYEHGWYCSKKCRNVKNKKTIAVIRKKEHDKWFNLAVNACIEWDSSAVKPSDDWIRWITEKVNEKMTNKIKRNTITRNLSKIEEEARKRNHAKS